jgi:hypothetical protein
MLGNKLQTRAHGPRHIGAPLQTEGMGSTGHGANQGGRHHPIGHGASCRDEVGAVLWRVGMGGGASSNHHVLHDGSVCGREEAQLAPHAPSVALTWLMPLRLRPVMRY